VIRSPEQDASEAEMEAMRAKQDYVKYFLVDFMEYNMRKVAADNARFCASNCSIF
jgi:hypothetical protein